MAIHDVAAKDIRVEVFETNEYKNMKALIEDFLRGVVRDLPVYSIDYEYGVSLQLSSYSAMVVYGATPYFKPATPA